MATQIHGSRQIKDGTITNDEISASAAIALSKLAALTSGNIIVGNGSNEATAVAMTGHIGISNAGVTTIQAGAIVDSMVSASAAIATSKLADGAEFVKRDGSVALTGNLDANSNKLTNVADGTNSGDAVNKGQLDAAIASATNGLDVKASVRAATTANITLSGTQTIDGVALNVDDRVLVKNQTTGSQNGLYLVKSGSWVRTTDADADAEVTAGLFTFVEEGTSNADSGWILNTDGAITVGTTSLSFTQFTGAGTVTAGAGLTKTGNTLDVVSANSAIVVNADDITFVVDTGADSLQVTASGVKMKNGTSAQIYVANSSGVFKRVSMSGHVAISNTGATTIQSGVITNSMINASAAIAFSKMQSGSSGQMVVCNGSGVPTLVTVSGDATMSSTGVLTITNPGLQSGNFVFNEVPSGTVNGVNTSFTLANTPVAGKTTVYLNGLLQKPTEDYTITGGSISFVTAPETGALLLANYIK